MPGTETRFPVYDLISPEKGRDPISELRELRERTPIAWVPVLDAALLTRHADIVSVLKDHRMAPANLTQGMRLLTPEQQAELMPLRRAVEKWMGHTNSADHQRFIGLLKRYFTPAMVNRLRPRVRELTHELLDAVEPKGRMDLVSDVAYPLPAAVIAEMLGVPPDNRKQLLSWSADIAAIAEIVSYDRLAACQRSLLAMQEYMLELVEERRSSPRDDLISMFVAAEREGVVDEPEILSNCVMLLFSGHETTGGLITNGLVQLFENPDQLELLKSNPELTPGAVEEMLRLAGPASMITRFSTEPVEVAGYSFPAGQQFLLALSAANRDPEVFPDPDRFDATRTPNKHVAFATGLFHCLGAALARMEGDEFFRILLSRFPNVCPGYDEPAWQPVFLISRRLKTLPVNLFGNDAPAVSDEHHAAAN
ncbi:cytochrome P-450 like protein [Saccharopolyspora subtropica]|uniref:Cytochrome P-450 like protein n=1 Tax=Saccharopolyspora thermophila TaxID=89367 RepID=A0A917NH43_9PSEU|nr:cytochrome P450 [Saccharopolyspora subtropica]GGJ00157.1 cytochrome P-450 like protein [Saccharopolyspora subtropica]